MVEIRINISELKKEGGEVTKKLAEFLKEKTQAEIETAVDSITVKSEEIEISKKYLRVLLKKYLHRSKLREFFRIISGEENMLMVKEKKTSEEE